VVTVILPDFSSTDAGEINLEELSAINKQVSELNW
jgi:hypothetical protein